MATKTLFDATRMSMHQAIDLTIESMRTHGPRLDHWAFAWSGGKDSTAALTFVIAMMEKGLIPRPQSITVLQADTRLEILPLMISAQAIAAELRDRGIEHHVVVPELDQRFFVYMFGRGVPPPKNRFRWCTSQLKIKPMEAKLRQLARDKGTKFLTITGVRQGESAHRDGTIAMSCGVDGAECRGCPNRCRRCLVPKREGPIRLLPIREGFDVLDNNILATPPEHLDGVLEMLRRQKARPRFTGGLEASRFSEAVAAKILSVNPDVMFFAYDRPGEKRHVAQAFRLIREISGWSPGVMKHHVGCYILCGYEGDTIADAEKRIAWVISQGVRAYPMFYRDENNTKRPSPWHDLIGGTLCFGAK
ncbi:MAG: phosphoadenosine phosphosulfate reductase family protein [Planctomycetaceae bacterium]|nr:phosphoadenosine phosphosulfate reductase family protein [Planctomycetaceae bacterium]